ncbi:MAG: 2Fe-2S iron-sulfur cluster binding domain-containing protein [Desulfomonilaceae bacterium]|nr:2Fe-2S iron-sulfur cluster binding domain-containing protein [Desulfomonilaceae bacterium]
MVNVFSIPAFSLAGVSGFLVPALSIASLATFLAVLILIAERYLMDYGEVDLQVNDKTFKVKGGNTLLNTLKEQKVFIPSACGGRATCAYCKVKALSGFPEILPTETPLLTKEEIKDNVRLSCQIKVKTASAIQIPEELFNIREYTATCESIVDLTYDIRLFRFQLIEPPHIEYKAGQYIQFQSPEYGDVSESVYRAYSMCGDCKDKDQIELMVRRVPEGIATTYMFDHLRVGEQVVFTGPFGDFYLRDTDRRMICVAGGSGMAPIRSIMLDMTSEQIEKRKPIFFFGARAKRDLFMVDEWREMEERNKGLTFVPALSSPEPDDDWDGETGRVTEVIPRYVEDLSDCEGYLCGSPGLLNACVDLLISLGIPEERIYYDKFE